MARTGLLIVNTGNGKGKTTAALGLAVRAIGQGMKVAVVQFIKGNQRTGEAKFFDVLEGIDFFVMGNGFVRRSKDPEQACLAARGAWDLACRLMSEGEYDMVILDELTHSLKYNFLSEEEVIEGLKTRPDDLHVVITGRGAGANLMELADLVSVIESPKHPYASGVTAQRGIEF